MFAAGILAMGAVLVAQSGSSKIDQKKLLTGPAVFVDAQDLKAGTFRKITVGDLPAPFATPSNRNSGPSVPRPENLLPQAPEGFQVDLLADGFMNPRRMLRAPNGDIILAETRGGQVRILRGVSKSGKPSEISVYAKGLPQPFGLALYPLGNNPQWLYVGNTTSVMRFAYKSGDLVATGEPETLINDLPRGGHSTRDLVFTADGKSLLVAVGSLSNVADTEQQKAAEGKRANILEYTPDGKYVGIYASGIRNPVGLGIHPETNEVWTSVNERDALGDNLVPDYITSVKRDGFYGWPWFYLGGNPDPRHKDDPHMEMKTKAIVPDVLVGPHNASLALTFYDGTQFPAEYRGDLFAGEHGSWNRAVRGGYEVVRVPLDRGKTIDGIFQDFLTGFVLPNGQPWGRPVGVVVTADGSLIVSDDGSNSLWRVTYTGR
jgi:glucose/arabinose dehydrogenase